MDESGFPQYLNALNVPASVDVVGIDMYGVLDPTTDTGYQAAWKTLLSKISASQQVFVIAQAFWAPSPYETITAAQMPTVAMNYWKLALSDPHVIGIMAFEWNAPLGKHFKSYFSRYKSIVGGIGLGGLPDVQAEYRVAGCSITTKCLKGGNK